MTARERLGLGVVVPVVTPLDDAGALDEDGLSRLIDHMIAGGIDGVFVLGTTGEYPRFEGEAWRRVVTAGVKYTAGRVPVYVGVTAAGGAQVRERAEFARDAGADAIVLSPTYYFALNQEEMVRLCESAVPQDALPLFLYNIPQHTGSQLEAETVRRIAASRPVVGIKDSSGDIDRLTSYLEAGRSLPGFRVMAGAEPIMGEAFKRGATGVVPSLGNVFPSLLAEVYAAAQAGAWDDVARQCALVDRINVLNKVTDSSLASVAWKKYALSRMGICGARMTEPAVPLTPATQAQIASHLAACGLSL